MKSLFYLLLSLKTAEGYESFGEFSIGADRKAADDLFVSLKGDPQLKDNCHFHIDLIETIDTLPEKIRSKCCTIEQLCENMELIAREVFRQKNLAN